MKYYFFPISIEEQEDPSNLGFAYALKHKDRWIETDNLIEVNTYDRGTTHLAYKNKVYMIHKDYVVLDENYRLYLGRESYLGTDKVE